MDSEKKREWTIAICAALKEALIPLSLVQRMIVSTKGCVGLTFPEVAEAIGRPLEEVKEHYQEACAALQTSEFLKPFLKEFASLEELLKFVGSNFPVDPEREEETTKRIYEHLGLFIPFYLRRLN